MINNIKDCVRRFAQWCWSFLWPWSSSRMAARRRKRCARGRHEMVRKEVIRRTCWAISDIELHCRYCTYKEKHGFKINYD